MSLLNKPIQSGEIRYDNILQSHANKNLYISTKRSNDLIDVEFFIHD